MSDAANTAPKQRGIPFKPGQSGNPAGKPKGARHKVTLAIEALLEGEAEKLTKKAITLAMAGDITALRLCMDRLAPVRRDRPVTFDLPKIETADDLPKATQAIMEAVAGGELTPSEAAELGKLVDAHAKAIEVTDLHRRLAVLEGGRT
ncbi:DUF5681 domain-containing protein [Bosea sp. (in: a-proteobacteria)]|jgi:hypothetical protein|uniref:DUF5681 domain-containing protein n=1 Tax=Bosea sp. (in: a-proteobacteria) TaxID=1871050 RepID=UPI002DDD3BA1|nr:DUF5681 domain-containing protein [Bosea sp. (in: a-proteobacteria)]HEV2508632.1 DUF5681 domain-containing protein [Bosea sp. (in: a-proteobacteria)]